MLNICLLGSGCHEVLPLLAASTAATATVHKLIGPTLPDFSHPLWLRITHLDLCLRGHVWSRYGWETWSGLAQMPCLSQLFFHSNPENYSPIYHGILLHCKLLEVLVPLFGSPQQMLLLVPGYATIAIDPRFVMLVIVSITANWEIVARGGEDRWIWAEKLMKKRRSGEIKIRHENCSPY
ncbi:hypothetical protein C8R44DRAFT_754099 [Mycena epipterygia]|nr:hypothetical protein C8R44DRAFT_754099 [Mycena epipterygia]